jgi:putative FmdB family regulatory protein
MPIYEYHCSKCGDFETMQRMSDKPLTQCPTCRRKVTKLISSTTFQLKGSGWYVTDYARKGETGGSKADKPDKKADAKTESATSESGSSSDAGGDDGGAKSEKKAATKKSEKAAAA